MTETINDIRYSTCSKIIVHYLNADDDQKQIEDKTINKTVTIHLMKNDQQNDVSQKETSNKINIFAMAKKVSSDLLDYDIKDDNVYMKFYYLTIYNTLEDVKNFISCVLGINIYDIYINTEQFHIYKTNTFTTSKTYLNISNVSSENILDKYIFMYNTKPEIYAYYIKNKSNQNQISTKVAVLNNFYKITNPTNNLKTQIDNYINNLHVEYITFNYTSNITKSQIIYLYNYIDLNKHDIGFTSISDFEFDKLQYYRYQYINSDNNTIQKLLYNNANYLQLYCNYILRLKTKNISFNLQNIYINFTGLIKVEIIINEKISCLEINNNEFISEINSLLLKKLDSIFNIFDNNIACELILPTFDINDSINVQISNENILNILNKLYRIKNYTDIMFASKTSLAFIGLDSPNNLLPYNVDYILNIHPNFIEIKGFTTLRHLLPNIRLLFNNKKFEFRIEGLTSLESLYINFVFIFEACQENNILNNIENRTNIINNLYNIEDISNWNMKETNNKQLAENIIETIILYYQNEIDQKYYLNKIMSIDPSLFGYREIEKSNVIKPYSAIAQNKFSRVGIISEKEYMLLYKYFSEYPNNKFKLSVDSILKLPNQKNLSFDNYLFCPYNNYPYINFRNYDGYPCSPKCTSMNGNNIQKKLCHEKLNITKFNNTTYDNYTINYVHFISAPFYLLYDYLTFIFPYSVVKRYDNTQPLDNNINIITIYNDIIIYSKPILNKEIYFLYKSNNNTDVLFQLFNRSNQTSSIFAPVKLLKEDKFISLILYKTFETIQDYFKKIYTICINIFGHTIFQNKIISSYLELKEEIIYTYNILSKIFTNISSSEFYYKNTYIKSNIFEKLVQLLELIEHKIDTTHSTEHTIDDYPSIDYFKEKFINYLIVDPITNYIYAIHIETFTFYIKPILLEPKYRSINKIYYNDEFNKEEQNLIDYINLNLSNVTKPLSEKIQLYNNYKDKMENKIYQKIYLNSLYSYNIYNIYIYTINVKISKSRCLNNI